MTDLDFQPSDFAAAPMLSARRMSEWINKKIARKLERAPKVYGYRGEIGDTFYTVGDTGCTHTAKLICIEEIK